VGVAIPRTAHDSRRSAARPDRDPLRRQGLGQLARAPGRAAARRRGRACAKSGPDSRADRDAIVMSDECVACRPPDGRPGASFHRTSGSRERRRPARRPLQHPPPLPPPTRHGCGIHHDLRRASGQRGTGRSGSIEVWAASEGEQLEGRGQAAGLPTRGRDEGRKGRGWSWPGPGADRGP